MASDEELDQARVQKITAEALLDERRTAAREAREAKLEEISPPCARPMPGKKTCGHPLNRHDPCSSCACPSFLSEDGEPADVAGERLMEEHPELFRKAKVN